MKRFIFIITILTFVCSINLFASGYDFTVLLNPKNYSNVDTIYRNSYGKQVFAIAFENMSVAMGKSAFGVKIPQKVVIKNLSLTVQAENITQDELDKTEFPRPLDFEILGLNLTIFGKKNVMKIKASRARVYKQNIVYLSPDSEMSIGENSAKLGSGATISLKGRILIIKSPSLGQLGVKI